VILASNFKTNIDDGFIRCFQSIIHFPMPRVSERLRLWQNTFPNTVQLAADINLKNVAEKYELTGASIVNIIQFCCLRALHRGDKIITSSDIKDGVSKEFGKEGKIFT
jgi:ATP-dependent 26S proteasome regulatory subunit